MGLFGFGKKKQADAATPREGMMEDAGGEFSADKAASSGNDVFWDKADFAFEIQKILPYKEQGSVLVGRALSGQLLPDTKVSYVDPSGRAVLNCTVGGIEQNGIRVKKASVCQFGLLGPTFALIVPDFAPNAFTEGNYLYHAVAEGTELSPLMEAFEGCRLRREREEEIRGAVYALMPGLQDDAVLSSQGVENPEKQGGAPTFMQERLRQLCGDYSVQELIFALTQVRDAENRARTEGGTAQEACFKEASDVLYPMMLEKLRSLDEVYLTIDKNTNFPFYNGGFVDVYTREEYAKLAVIFYKEQFRELEVRALPVANPKLLKTEEGKTSAAQMPAFALFYYLGMERVLLDNGMYRAAISRGDVLPPPEASGKPNTAVPVANPALRTRILDFFGEARWKVNYEKRAQVLQAKEHAMLTEVARAKFLIPMKYDGAAKPQPGTNQIVFNKDTKLMFAAVKNTAGESYTPVFTDFAEIGKMYQPKDWGAAVISIQDAIGINKGDGIVVNPASENLILKEKAIRAVEEIAKQLKEKAENAAGSAKGVEPETALVDTAPVPDAEKQQDGTVTRKA